ncbi:hypothetical protein EGJ86_07425 [Pseudomonas sp. o96-267]|uniref:hypothetical protein n=1 Tax=Pseudomonas sp. o96-267 TaxID=2479853 RepID=UPI000F776219|nr:hypothetical protein [Pseudomonas sp. o96-267]RRV41307.1 hypothetical protein EGJ86_07425 [Pseudomonas sp. o96-267]
MTYTLTQQSLHGLRRALTTPMSMQATLHLERPASRVAVMLELEQVADKLAVSIVLGHHRSTIRLQANDPANSAHICEQIEAIANGTADTAETGAIGTPTAPAREPFALDTKDEASLRHLVRMGGTRHLQCGVSITVHNTLQSMQRDALVTTQVGTAHLQAGTPRELYVVAAKHIEAAFNAA